MEEDPQQTNYSFRIVYAWCLSYMKPYRGLFIGYLMLGILGSLILVAVPKCIQVFIDTVLPERNLALFYSVLAVLLVLLAAMIIANNRKNTLGLIIQEKTSRDLQQAVFAQLRQLGFPYYERHSVGETLTFFNTEIPAIHEIYRRYFPSIVQNVMMLVITVGYLMTISPRLSLLFVPCILLYYFSAPYFEKKAVLYIRSSMDEFKELGKKQYDSLSASLELRVHAAENWDIRRSLETNERASHHLFMHFIYINIRAILRRISVYGGAILLFVYGFQLIQGNMVSVGEFIAFLLLYFRSMFTMTTVVTLLSEQKVLVHKAEALYRFMKLKPEVIELLKPAALSAIQGGLEFRNVHFGYGREENILRGFDLALSPGQRVAIVGTSGNGKSTLTKLVSRFYDPRAGEILLDDTPIQRLSIGQLREAVGFVFQETYLFGASISDNIRFGNPEATDDEVEAAARAASAHDFIMELPNGYDTLVGERGNKLSGGQKQRIAIARMLIKNPAIVVLDEATSALDSQTESDVMQALDRLLLGRTTLTVAHRISTIRHYDLIVVMDQGRIAEMGTYDELMRANGLFGLLVLGEEEREHERREMDQNVS
ncbi:ABC transporter ATP-binding protein [Paenibacillus lycopersici]|uniref:ABC transporter ATP-binding protein n=1 Tax=Paenibacillus lycopersici TaxID=2704462 RepID=A0A6C0G5H8_9BACL|nr:ABC transporter ATP-binding protein [Paenibacillus lycopersici]QHT62854.1 ABC transporter ATP-binding protein [Paenibacillus lycopersici]